MVKNTSKKMKYLKEKVNRYYQETAQSHRKGTATCSTSFTLHMYNIFVNSEDFTVSIIMFESSPHTQLQPAS